MPEAVAVTPVTPSAPAGDPFASALDNALEEFATTGDIADPPIERVRRDEDEPTQPQKKKQKKPPEPEPEEDEEEEVEELPETDEEPDDDEEADEAASADKKAAKPERGSKEKPYTVKELPDDQYVELKADGERVVVPVKALADSYAGQQTITRRINAAQQLTQRAEQALEQATKYPQRVNESFKGFVRDPGRMFEFFFGVSPVELPYLAKFKSALERPANDPHEAAELFTELAARLIHNERSAPETRSQRLNRIEQQRIEAQRRQLEQQQQQEAQQREMQERAARAKAVWDPGWNEGLRRAGFPKLDKESHEALVVEVRTRIQQRHRQQPNKPIDKDVIAELTERSIRWLKSEGVISTKKEKPAPVANLFGGRKATPSSNGRPAASGDTAGRKKDDPDVLLRGTRAKDFYLR